MPKTNFRQLSQRLATLASEINKTAEWHHKNPTYSAEGKSMHMQSAAKRLNYGANIADIRLAAQTFQDSVNAKYTEARARLYPAAANPTEQLAAELAAQRVLARDITEENAGDLLKELGATPARGIVVGELKARGVLPQSVLEAFEVEAAPELQNAEHTLTAAATTARLVEEQLAALENTIQNPALVDGFDIGGLTQVGNYLDGYFSEPLDTEGPLTFQGIKSEAVYSTDPTQTKEN